MESYSSPSPGKGVASNNNGLNSTSNSSNSNSNGNNTRRSIRLRTPPSLTIIPPSPVKDPENNTYVLTARSVTSSRPSSREVPADDRPTSPFGIVIDNVNRNKLHQNQFRDKLFIRDEKERIEIERKADVEAKFKVEYAFKKHGLSGLMRIWLETNKSTCLIWRLARQIRELVIKSPNVKDEVISNYQIYNNISLTMSETLSNEMCQSQLLRLLGAIVYQNDLVRRKCGELGVISKIIDAISNHMNTETLIIYGLIALTNLCNNSPENRSRYIEENGVDQLLVLLNKFKSNPKINQNICFFIVTLAGSNDLALYLDKRGITNRLVDILLSYSFDRKIQLYGCWGLHNIAIASETIRKQIRKLGNEICKMALENFPDDGEMKDQCNMLQSLLSSKNMN